MFEKLNPHSQYRPSTQPLPLGRLGQAPGLLRLAAGRRPTGSPGPWEAPGKARPAARPRPRLAVETGTAGTRGGRSVFPPSGLRGSVPSGRLRHGSGRLQAQTQPRPPVPTRPGNRPALLHSPGLPSPGRGRGSAAGRASPRSYLVAQTFKTLFRCPAQKLF